MDFHKIYQRFLEELTEMVELTPEETKLLEYENDYKSHRKVIRTILNQDLWDEKKDGKKDGKKICTLLSKIIFYQLKFDKDMEELFEYFIDKVLSWNWLSAIFHVKQEYKTMFIFCFIELNNKINDSHKNNEIMVKNVIKYFSNKKKILFNKQESLQYNLKRAYLSTCKNNFFATSTINLCMFLKTLNHMVPKINI